MAKLTVIVGLPGSGKSRWMQKRRDLYPGVYAEDFMANSRGDRPGFANSRHYDKLICALQDGLDSIIADIAYCDSGSRAEVEPTVRRSAPSTTMEWIFFEKNLDQCVRNIQARGKHEPDREPKVDREIAEAHRLSKVYSIPECVKRLPVWHPGATDEN